MTHMSAKRDHDSQGKTTTHAESRVTIKTNTLESWNCTNVRTASFMQQPYMIAVTIEAKLSFIRMTSEASFTLSTRMPIESAVLSAGPRRLYHHQ